MTPNDSDGSVTQFPIKPRHLLRHGAAVVLLIFSSQTLTRWYAAQDFRTYLLFWGLFLAAILITAGKPIANEIRRVKFTRAILILALVLLAFPWSECLQLRNLNNREDFTRQIFYSFLFIYAVLSIFNLFPGLRGKITSALHDILNVSSSRTWLFWMPVLLFLALTTSISLRVNRGIPLTQDSAAYLFQAKIFQKGRLFAPAPQLPEFFSTNGDMLVMVKNRWFSIYQPGYPLLLMIAMLIHGESMLSPILGAATVCIWMLYIRRWHSRQSAVLFGWLSVFSPFLFLMHSTWMIHVPELFVATTIVYLSRMQTEEENGWGNAVLFCLFLSAVLIRPYSLFPYLLPALAYTIWNRVHHGSYTYPAVCIAGMLIGGLLLSYYQKETSGNAFVSGYIYEYPQFHFGFGQGIQSSSRINAVVNTSNNLLALNHWLTGWYSGALIFALVFLVRKNRFSTWDRILLLSCFSLAIFYAAVYWQDLVFGPRFFFLMTPFLLLMMIRSAGLTEDKEPELRSQSIPALLLVSLLLFLPSRFSQFIHKYNLSSSYAYHLNEALRKVGDRKMLVFLGKSTREYFVNWNDPFLRGSVILCRSLLEKNMQVQQLFPDYKPVYFRTSDTFSLIHPDPTYRFFDDPGQETVSSFSFFQLAVHIESARNDTDVDFFDTCYHDFLRGNDAQKQLLFLSQDATQIQDQVEYRKNYHLALIHLARVLLLPQAAFQQHDYDWANHFDFRTFQEEWDESVKYLQQSGEIGKGILAGQNQTRARMDRNHDGQLQNNEVEEYLTRKLID